MENLIQNFEKNHENYKMPSIQIAEKIIKEGDGTIKVLCDAKYDYLQEIFYVKELCVGYVRRCDYKNAIQYYLKLLENAFLYFRYHAYKQLGRIYDEMDDNDEFVRLYNKFK